MSKDIQPPGFDYAQPPRWADKFLSWFCSEEVLETLQGDLYEQKYEYRTEISWWIFAVTSIGALIITLLTVSYQAVKAALMNPVNSLRSE